MVTLIKIAQYALYSDDRKLEMLIDVFLKENPILSKVSFPDTADARTLSMAAGLIELLANIYDQEPPEWSAAIGEMPKPFFVWAEAVGLDWFRQQYMKESPEPLRKRKIYAPENFLKAV